MITSRISSCQLGKTRSSDLGPKGWSRLGQPTVNETDLIVSRSSEVGSMRKVRRASTKGSQFRIRKRPDAGPVGLAYYNLTTTGCSIPRSLAKQVIHPIGGLSTELGQYVVYVFIVRLIWE